MSNMSYCRFENTYNDLYECSLNMDDKDMSAREIVYKARLLEMCRHIAETNQ